MARVGRRMRPASHFAAEDSMTTLARTLAGRLALGALLAFAVPALADAPTVGSPAPAFKLQDQAGKWHSLDQYKGKWVVLYFYPKDDTPGCTTQACELRDNIFAFRKVGAHILGVSVDDVESKKKFAEKHSLPFPVLADPSKEMTKRYGVLTKFMGVMELAQRDTFLIDPQGRIAKHWAKVDPKGHSDMVLAEIRNLQAKAGGKPSEASTTAKSAG
jgi:thioredoxin-dependent peroxiredoxin